MKHTFRRLIAILIASFTLSSCSNFLPQLPTSRQNNSQLSEESSFANSKKGSSTKASSKEEDKSSANNNKPSSVIEQNSRSSSNYNAPSSEQQVSSSEQLNNLYPLDADYCIRSFDGYPRGEVDEVYSARFAMVRSLNGENVPLDSSSYITTDDDGITIYSNVINGTEPYFEAQLLPRIAQLFTLTVHLTSQNGISCEKEIVFPVSENNNYQDIIVDYDSYRYLSIAYGDTIYFRNCHKRGRNNALQFNETRPYDIGLIEDNNIQIKGYRFEDDNTTLAIDITPLSICKGRLDLKLIFSNGDTQNIIQYYYVDPPYNFEPQDGVIISYNETKEVRFDFRNFKNSQHQAQIDTSNVNYYCLGGVECELLTIDRNFLIFMFSNGDQTDYSTFYLGVGTADGYFIEFYMSVVSYESYYGDYHAQCDIIDRICYQQECTLRFYLINRAGDYIRLKDVTITSKYGIFQNATYENIDSNYCYYTVTPNNYGYEEIEVVMTDYNDVQHTTRFGYDIPQPQ